MDWYASGIETMGGLGFWLVTEIQSRRFCIPHKLQF
jgi:hypothetical protein